MARTDDPNVRRFARDLAKMERRVGALENRKPSLAFSSIEDGYIPGFDKDGNETIRVGKQPDGTHNVIVKDGPIPPTPSAPVVTVQPGVAEVRWDGTFADAGVAPLDLSHMTVHYGFTHDFVPSSGNQVATIAGVTGVAMLALPAGSYSFKLVSVALSGKTSGGSVATNAVVPIPADAVQIGQALEDLDAKTDGLITEAGQLDSRLTQAEGDLVAHEGRLDVNEQTINELETVTIPALDGEITDLRDTQLPAMNSRLTQAESDIVTTGNQLDARIDQAFVDIDAAQTDATAALTMAGSKNKVFYGTAAPTATNPAETAQGDLYRQIDATGDVIAEYQWNGSDWLPQQITSAAISNLDLGKLTAGSAFIAEAVVEKLWVEVVRARKIIVDQLLVGQGENQIPWSVNAANPAYQDWSNIDTYGGPAPQRYPDTGATEGPHLYNSADGVTPGQSTITWRIGERPYTSPNGSSGWAVEAGEELSASVYIKNGGSYPGSAPDVQIMLAWYTAAGAYISAQLSAPVTQTWSWQKISVKGTAPATAARCLIYVRQNQPGGVRIDMPALYRVKDGNLIATGSITGDHVQANSVAAAIATFLELNADQITSGTINTARLNALEIAAATAAFQQVDIKNLFVTTGTFTEAVINKLWADVIHARKLTSNYLAVGDFTNLIARGVNVGGATMDWASALTIDTTDKPNVLAESFKSAKGQSTMGSTAAQFEVDAEAEYVFEVWIKADVPNSRIYFELRDQNGGHAGTCTAVDGLDGFPSGTYPVGNATVPTTWTKWSAKVKLNAGVRTVRLGSVYFNHPNGSEQNAQVWVAGLAFKRRYGGELIVDGSITAAKVAAKAILAEHIDTLSLAADTGFIAQMRTNILTVGSVPDNALKSGTGAELLPDPMWMDTSRDLVSKSTPWSFSTTSAHLTGGQPRYLLCSGASAIQYNNAYVVTDIPARPGEKLYLEWVTRRNGANFGIRTYLYPRLTDGSRGPLLCTMNQDASQTNLEFVTNGILDVVPDGVVTVDLVVQIYTASPSSGYYGVNRMSLKRALQGTGSTGSSVEISPQGIRLTDSEGAETVSLTSEGDTLITIKDSTTGDILAGLGSDGSGSFTELMAANMLRSDGPVITGADPLASNHGSGLYGATMNGRDLLGATFTQFVESHPKMTDALAWLTAMPHGVVANGVNSTSDGTNAEGRWTWDGAGGEIHYRSRLQVTATFVSGRQYLVQYKVPAVRETGSPSLGSLGASLLRRSAPGGSVGVGSGASVPGTRMYLQGGGGYTQGAATVLVRCPEDVPAGRIQLVPELYVYAGKTAESTDTPDARTWEVSVMDIGLSRGALDGTYYSLIKQGTEETPPPAPEPEPVKTYTSTWDASWWQSYRNAGSSYAPSNYDGKVAQGYYNSTTGYLRGLVGFPSMISTLSGATIKKVEVYVYASHWWYSAGGTLVIGTHDGTSKPSSTSSISGVVDVKRQKLKRAEGRWITLPSSVHAGVKSGSVRGIQTYIASTSKEYYGQLTGSKTKIRVTYEK